MVEPASPAAPWSPASPAETAKIWDGPTDYKPGQFVKTPAEASRIC